MKNIYDLEGNYYEWTAEGYGADGRAARGGIFVHVEYDDFYPASDRDYGSPDNERICISARSALYIPSINGDSTLEGAQAVQYNN